MNKFIKYVITIIFLLVGTSNIKAQTFNNIVENIGADPDGNKSEYSNYAPVKYQYNLNKCIGNDNFIIVGHHKEDKVLQTAILKKDETGNFEVNLLSNIYDEKTNLVSGSHTYDVDENVIIASSQTTLHRNADEGGNLQNLKPYIMERSKDGVWHFKQFLSVEGKKPPTKFGMSVAIEGNIAVVGAYLDNTDSIGQNKIRFSGSAYIFRKENNDWKFYQKLTAKERGKDDYFGMTVDIENGTIIVGAPKNDDDRGAVYVFNMNNKEKWEQTQKLIVSNVNSNDYSGYAKFVNGEIVIAASERDKKKGGIYLFKKDRNGKWEEYQSIIPSDLDKNDAFGINGSLLSASANDNYLVIGCPNQDNTKYNSGAVYVYKRNSQGSWMKIIKLTHKTPIYEQRYGANVLISGDYLYIGHRDGLQIIKFQESN